MALSPDDVNRILSAPSQRRRRGLSVEDVNQRLRQRSPDQDRAERVLGTLDDVDSQGIVQRSLRAAGFPDTAVERGGVEAQLPGIVQAAEQAPDVQAAARDLENTRELSRSLEAIPEARSLAEIQQEELARIPRPLRPFATGIAQAGLRSSSVLARTMQAIGVDIDVADALSREAGALSRARQGLGSSAIEDAAENAISSITEVMTSAGFGVGHNGIAIIAGIRSGNDAITEGRDAGLEGMELANFAIGQGVIETATTMIFNKVLGPGVEALGDPVKAGAKTGIVEGLKRFGMTSLAELPEELTIEYLSNVQRVLQEVDPNALSAENVKQTFVQTFLTTMLTAGLATGIQAAEQRFSGSPGAETDTQTPPRITDETQERRKNPDTITVTKESHKALKDAASRDELTGLGNRRIEKKAVKTLFRRGDREGTPTAVVGFDIGNFKAINDNLGENVGDQALQLFADSMQKAIRTERAEGEQGRPRDVAGVATRRGGDEFRIILPNTTAEGGQIVADRVAKIFDAKLKEAGIQLPAEGRPVFAAPGVVQRDAGDTRTEVDDFNAEIDQGIKGSKRRVKTELGVPLTREEAQQPAQPVVQGEVASDTPVGETQQRASQGPTEAATKVSPSEAQTQQPQAPQPATPAQVRKAAEAAPEVLTPSQAKAVAEGRTPRRKKVVKRKKGVPIAPVTEAKAFKEAKAAPKPPKTPRQFFGAGFRRAAQQGRARLEGLRQELRSKAGLEADTRQELAGLARRLLPRDEAAKLLQAIAKAKTPRQAQAIRGRIGAALEVVAKRAAIRRFKRLRKKTRFRTLAPQVVDMLGGKDEVAKLRALDVGGMDAADVDAVSDRLAEAQTLHKAVTKMRIGGTVNTLKGWVDETTTNIEKHGRFVPDDTRSQTGKVSRFLNEEQQKIEELMVELDGGVEDGPNSRVFYQEVVDGVTEQNRVMQEEEQLLLDQLGEKALDTISRWDRGSLRPSTAAKLRGKTAAVSVKMDSGTIVKMTRQEMAAILAHAEANREKLLRAGFIFKRSPSQAPVKLTEADLARIESVANRISPLIMGMKRTVLNSMNGGLQSKFDEAHIRLRGFSNLVEGAFFPIRRDVQAKVPRLEGLSDYNSFIEASIGNLREAKQRTNSNLPLVIDDIMTIHNDHVRRIAGFIGLAEKMRNVLFVLNDPKTRKTMDRKAGAQRHRALRRIYDAVAQEVIGRRPPEGLVNTLVGKLVSNATKGVLGANVFVFLKQPVSYLLSATELRSGAVAKGFKAAVNLGSLTPETSRLDKLMVKWNPNLWHRFRTNRLRLQGLFDTDTPITNRVQSLSQRAMGLLTRGDRAAIRGIFKASIEEAKTETNFKFGTPEFIEAVNRKVDRVIARTQPAVLTMDQPGIALEAQTNALVKTSAAMFMNQRNQIYNIVRRGIRRGGRRGLRDVTLALVASPLLIAAIDELRRLTYGYEDDRDTRERVEDSIVAVVKQDLALMYGGQIAVDMANLIDRQMSGQRGRVKRSENIVSSVGTEVLEGTQDLLEAVTRAGETFKAGDKRGQSVAMDRGLRGLQKLTFAFSTAGGVPVASPLRLAKGFGAQFGPKSEYSAMFKERARLRKLADKEQEAGRQLLSDFQHEKLAAMEETLTLANLSFSAADRGEVSREIANAYATKRVLEGMQMIERLEATVPADTFNKGLEGPSPAEELAREVRAENGDKLLQLATRIKELSFVKKEFDSFKTLKTQRRFLRENPEAREQIAELRRLRQISRAAAKLRTAAADPRVPLTRRTQLRKRIKTLLEKVDTR